MNDVIQLEKTQEIALVGILSALNIASRLLLVGLPNIKPVTSIIILSVLYFGLRFGIELTVVTTIVSDIFLGLGLWTFFQILSWVVICFLTDCIRVFCVKRQVNPPIFLMSIYSALMGYVFGFVVSFEQFVLGGWALFIPYYISGLFFDTLHAIGNFGFYFVSEPLFSHVIEKQFR